MDCVIISGGVFLPEDAAVIKALKEKPYIIAADKGAAKAYGFGIAPDCVIGDFDSAEPDFVKKLYDARSSGKVEIISLNKRKDDTDTEAALRLALKRHSGDVFIFGGTGGRIDHTLANIHILRIAAVSGRNAFLCDKNNRVRVLVSPVSLKKEELFGDYISLFALTTQVEGLTLKGFSYPLSSARLVVGTSLGTSNELVCDEGEIFFKEGELIMIESKDN